MYSIAKYTENRRCDIMVGMSTLRETIRVYKTRFPFILQTIRPILICQCLALIAVVAGEFVYVDSFNGWGVAVLWFLRLAIILIALIQMFLYTPAAIRTFQKQAEGQDMDISQSVLFQRMNMLSFIQLFFYYIVYALYIFILALAPGGFLIYLAVIFEKSWGLLMVMPAVIAGIALIAYGSYINFSKIFFPLNIYFSKGLRPWECIQESIRIGEGYRKKVWKAVGGFMLLTLVGALIVSAVQYLISPTEFVATMLSDQYNPSFTYKVLSSFLAIIVGVFAITPLTYMYMSMTYVKIASGDKKVIS